MTKVLPMQEDHSQHVSIVIVYFVELLDWIVISFESIKNAFWLTTFLWFSTPWWAKDSVNTLTCFTRSFSSIMWHQGQVRTNLFLELCMYLIEFVNWSAHGLMSCKFFLVDLRIFYTWRKWSSLNKVIEGLILITHQNRYNFPHAIGGTLLKTWCSNSSLVKNWMCIAVFPHVIFPTGPILAGPSFFHKTIFLRSVSSPRQLVSSAEGYYR